MSYLKDECYQDSHLSCFCIEFHLDEHHRRGFHTSQLIEYALDPNPDAEQDKNAPPQKLSLVFSTADIIILGWRLDRLAKLLQENRLASVNSLPKRYAELDRQKPFVASIQIKPLSGEGN